MSRESNLTAGEFIDLISTTEDIYAQIFIEEWKALVTPKQWEEYRLLPLTKELVLIFAEDMASYFRELISSTCGEKLYNKRIRAGHDFLREVYEKAKKLGIDVELKEIDPSLTYTEMMVEAGLVEVKDGMVKLTSEGEQAAKSVEEQLHPKDKDNLD